MSSRPISDASLYSPSARDYGDLCWDVCDDSVNQNGAVYAVASPNATAQNPWACNLPPGVSGNNGVICRWK